MTLIILIIEVRDHSDAIRTANRQSVASRYEAIVLERTANEELARIMTKADSELELTSEETLQYYRFFERSEGEPSGGISSVPRREVGRRLFRCKGGQYGFRSLFSQYGGARGVSNLESRWSNDGRVRRMV